MPRSCELAHASSLYDALVKFVGRKKLGATTVDVHVGPSTRIVVCSDDAAVFLGGPPFGKETYIIGQLSGSDACALLKANSTVSIFAKTRKSALSLTSGKISVQAINRPIVDAKWDQTCEVKLDRLSVKNTLESFLLADDDVAFHVDVAGNNLTMMARSGVFAGRFAVKLGESDVESAEGIQGVAFTVNRHKLHKALSLLNTKNVTMGIRANPAKTVEATFVSWDGMRGDDPMRISLPATTMDPAYLASFDKYAEWA